LSSSATAWSSSAKKAHPRPLRPHEEGLGVLHGAEHRRLHGPRVTRFAARSDHRQTARMLPPLCCLTGQPRAAGQAKGPCRPAAFRWLRRELDLSLAAECDERHGKNPEQMLRSERAATGLDRRSSLRATSVSWRGLCNWHWHFGELFRVEVRRDSVVSSGLGQMQLRAIGSHRLISGG
jgi:hypothetical protein